MFKQILTLILNYIIFNVNLILVDYFKRLYDVFNIEHPLSDILITVANANYLNNWYDLRKPYVHDLFWQNEHKVVMVSYIDSKLFQYKLQIDIWHMTWV